eukprot:TRINITY_DN16540_c0_g1_i2.p2 TRINITY_DN16540_c0_g1~~TRINITY_DN16540_c0_g1_i2.p2  ORF type:complete len:178 (+),score=51.04 TRINITY_DN16540_c0_g1_i2:140-673(+)
MCIRDRVSTQSTGGCAVGAMDIRELDTGAISQRIQDIDLEEAGLTLQLSLLAKERQELQHKLAAAEEDRQGSIRVTVRKSDVHSYKFEVEQSSTILELKTRTLLALGKQMEGSADSTGVDSNRGTSKPFDERQMDIYNTETCKLLAGAKTIRALGLKDGAVLRFNIRLWDGSDANFV